jgi:nucleotide-binding universal stress UspA family protein
VLSHRIVVGIDGSVGSERALRWAAHEAIDRGIGLDIVHAWTVPYVMYSEGGFIDPEPFEQGARSVLAGAVDALSGLGSECPDLRPLLVRDGATAALLNAAATAELLVVGSRGHGGFVGLLLGSVSQECVATAQCSVAVVPGKWIADISGRVLVGVDGSKASVGALHWAVAEAARRNAHLTVLNAYDCDRVAFPIGTTWFSDHDVLERASKALTEEMVAEALAVGNSRPSDIEVISSPRGAARALVELTEGADLLVVGSRGRGSVRGVLLGSVSQQCVHHAHCPVVVTR